VNSTSIESARKKPYAPPRLIAYGTVGKLTQTGFGSAADGGTGNMLMKCL